MASTALTSTLQFWLSFNNGAERIRLPVNPSSITITSTHGFEDVNVSKLGEYTVIGYPQLRTFAFSSFFPKEFNPTYCEYPQIPDPWKLVQTIERWQASGKPCRLTITGTPINYAVTIRSFKYEQRAGSIGDIYYELELKEFVFIGGQKTTTGRPKG
jgi:hypothetical protein